MAPAVVARRDAGDALERARETRHAFVACRAGELRHLRVRGFQHPHRAEDAHRSHQIEYRDPDRACEKVAQGVLVHVYGARNVFEPDLAVKTQADELRRSSSARMMTDAPSDRLAEEAVLLDELRACGPLICCWRRHAVESARREAEMRRASLRSCRDSLTVRILLRPA